MLLDTASFKNKWSTTITDYLPGRKGVIPTGVLGDVPGKGSGGVVVAVGGRAADVLGRKYFVRVWPVE